MAWTCPVCNVVVMRDAQRYCSVCDCRQPDGLCWLGRAARRVNRWLIRMFG